MADLWEGSAAAVMRERLGDGSVDLVYADPPYGNAQEWKGKAGAFSDRWRLDDVALEGWARLDSHSRSGAELMRAVARGENSRGYLGMMAGLLLEVRRVMRPQATLWLQFDDTMGAELRLLCDVVFGTENALGVCIWKRTSAHATRRAWGRIHDQIAVYGRSRVARWRLARLKSVLVHGDPMTGLFVEGLLEDRLGSTAVERVGYPTQKPVALIERFIEAGSLPGGLLLDPTCGSGSSLVAAEGMGRRAVGIDISPAALNVARERLEAVATQRAAASAQLDLFGIAA